MADKDDADQILFFEDLSKGDRFSFASHTITSEEIIAFAKKYDPQPFHLETAGDENSVFGGLVASGWHTVCICNRLRVDDVFSKIATMGGRGVENLRWPQPVRPGDELSGTIEVKGSRDMGHTERGTIDFHTVLRNQENETVLSLYDQGIIRRDI